MLYYSHEKFSENYKRDKNFYYLIENLKSNKKFDNLESFYDFENLVLFVDGNLSKEDLIAFEDDIISTIKILYYLLKIKD